MEEVIKEDEDWKKEAADQKEKMSEKSSDDMAWIPVEEVETYLDNISKTLDKMSQGIQSSLEHLKAKVKSEGEQNND